MITKNLTNIKTGILSSTIIKFYLFDYLEDKINQIIEDNEISEENQDEIHIIGYDMDRPDSFLVYINFFDEISECGYGIEEERVNLEDFLNWIKNR